MYRNSSQVLFTQTQRKQAHVMFSQLINNAQGDLRLNGDYAIEVKLLVSQQVSISWSMAA